MASPARPAAAWAAAITVAWPSRLGAAKPSLTAPSLLTAEPRITAEMASPSASACSSRLSTTTPAPLPKTVPWAASSNGRQCPSREVIQPA